MPDNFVELIYRSLMVIIPAVTAFVVAWFGHRTALIKAVKREAVNAERDLGDGGGEVKHARVHAKIKKSWTVRGSTLDGLISTRGKIAADEDAKERKSKAPPSPDAN